MKTSIIFLMFFLSLSSCDYSQLKKENAHLKYKIDSLSTLLNNVSAEAIRQQKIAMMQQRLADSAAMAAIIQAHLADSVYAKYVQLLNKNRK